MSNPNTLTAPNPADQEALQAERQDAYGRYLELEAQGLPADGPNLNKIGLDYTERIKLGYDGSMDNFVDDAKAWQAEQEEQARREAFHAENNAKAEAWKQETKALRDARQQANDRVAELADGTAAVKGMSYKEKLEAGGEIGVRKTAEWSAMPEEEAIALAEAEGHDVSHRKPRVLEVVTNKAAEERAREMAELLKAQLPRATEADPTSTEGAESSTSASGEPTGSEASTAETTAADPDEVEPVTALDDASLRGRLKTIWGKGRDKLLKLYLGVENRVVSPTKHAELSEAQLKRRRFILNGAIGAAVVYKTWATYNGMHSGGGGLVAEAAAASGGNGGSQSNNQEVMDALSGTGGKHNSSDQLVDALTGNGGGHEAAGAIPDALVLSHSGDTVEGVLTNMAEQHGAHLSEGQIHALVSQTLEQNNLSWDDARTLPVGYKFTIPDAVKAQIANS